MTFRQALGGDAHRLHALLEEVLEREDVAVVLFDGDRAVSYITGFGLSPSQHEFMALEIERVLRAAGATRASRSRRRHRKHGHQKNSHLSIALPLVSVPVGRGA
jgi:hypothetical protein